jgi:hypothetical protein
MIQKTKNVNPITQIWLDKKKSHSNSQAKWIHESCWNSYGVNVRFNGK